MADSTPEPFDFSGYAKKWGVPTEWLVNLQNTKLGIFAGVEHETIRHILDGLTLQRYEKNEPVFRERHNRAEVGIHIILNGQFAVKHHVETSSKNLELRIAMDGPGVILGDVELLTIGLTTKETQRGQDGKAFSSIFCHSEDGACVLSTHDTELLFETRSFALFRNFSKLVAVKLLNRNSETDRQGAEKPRVLLVEYLSRLVETHKVREDLEEKQGLPHNPAAKYIVLRHDITQAEASKFLKISKGTISTLCLPSPDKPGVLYSNGISWKGHEIRMSAAFHKALVNKSFDQLFRKRRQR